MSQGQLEQTHFMENVGGLNLTDSVFKAKDGQAVGGYNFDYSIPGGFQKILGPAKINSAADSQLNSLGFGLYNTAAGSKTLVRAAGTKLQNFDTSTPQFTALSDDTSLAASTPLTSGSTVPVIFSQFNNGTSNVLWALGGGQTLPNGVYSTTKYTQNGVPAPTTSAFTAGSVGSGGTLGPGVYKYTLVFRKTSTQALSNAGGEASVTAVTTDSVSLAWTFTNNDTTRFDAIYLYRSAVGGSTGFTTGDLVATLSISATTYTDSGSSLASSQNIPRAGSLVLDNSVLTTATYNAMTVFKRRLVVATGSTLYLSDLNKSESWPTVNTITIPSGGDIKGLAVISFTSPQANTLDEILCIFKERELWVITGDSYSDWVLKFIDQSGCSTQSIIAQGSGFLAWVDYRGVYLWDGTSKPIYCSTLLEPLFSKDGDIDKTKLAQGVGQFYRKANSIIWYLSSKTYGTQKFALKMDLKQTLPQVSQDMTGRIINGVITPEKYTNPVYAALSYIPSNAADEMLVVGDDAGYCYNAYNGYSDGGSSTLPFAYKTRPLDMGDPNSTKLFHKVIVWVQNFGDWDLSLDYWSDYHVGDSYKASRALPISNGLGNSAALWDVAFWDIALWDDYNTGIMPVIFNLDAGIANNNQGTSLQLQFRNDNASEPISIHGFSVIWSEMGGITA